MKLKPVRIGLWDQYGGSMPSGWVRWLFEQYEFPFDVVYPQTLDAGNLNAKFDVLLFVDGGIPARDNAGRGGQGDFGGGQPARRCRSGGIPPDAWPCDGRENGAGAEEVRRERRDRPDDRIIDALGYLARPADQGRAGRARRRRRGTAAAQREVLHPGHHPAKRGSTTRTRSRTAWTITR